MGYLTEARNKQTKGVFTQWYNDQVTNFMKNAYSFANVWLIATKEKLSENGFMPLFSYLTTTNFMVLHVECFLPLIKTSRHSCREQKKAWKNYIEATFY